MHDQKANIHEHINNIHRETTPAMKLNQRLSSIDSNLYMGVLHTISLLALLALLFNYPESYYNVQMRVSIFVFPLEL